MLDLLAQDEGVKRVLGHRGNANMVDIASAPGLRPPLLALMNTTGARTPLLVVTATGRDAGDMVTALRGLIGADKVAEFPSWETLPHERLSPRSDTVGRRLAVLRRLSHPDQNDVTHGALDVVVASVRAVMQPIAKAWATSCR